MTSSKNFLSLYKIPPVLLNEVKNVHNLWSILNYPWIVVEIKSTSQMVEISHLCFHRIVDRIFPCPKLFPGGQIQYKEISMTPSLNLFWMSKIQKDKILIKNNFFRILMCAEFMTPGFRQERPFFCIFPASIKFANLKILPFRYYNNFKTWCYTVKNGS